MSYPVGQARNRPKETGFVFVWLQVRAFFTDVSVPKPERSVVDAYHRRWKRLS